MCFNIVSLLFFVFLYTLAPVYVWFWSIWRLPVFVQSKTISLLAVQPSLKIFFRHTVTNLEITIIYVKTTIEI